MVVRLRADRVDCRLEQLWLLLVDAEEQAEGGRMNN
jgi:hypothetical protein